MVQRCPHGRFSPVAVTEYPVSTPPDEEVVDLEAEVSSLETWDGVREEFQELHQRMAFMVCRLGREVSSSAEHGCVDQASLCLLRELSVQKDELEWLIQLAEIEQLTDTCVAARSICLRQSHLDTQPLIHTRLVANQEVNENLKGWKEAMAAEYRSLLEKGAIQEVSDQQVRSWMDAGEDVEVLPGRGVASEKPAEPPQLRPRIGL